MSTEALFTSYCFSRLDQCGFPVFEIELIAVSRARILDGGKYMMQAEVGQLWMVGVNADIGKVYSACAGTIIVLADAHYLFIWRVNRKAFTVGTTGGFK